MLFFTLNLVGNDILGVFLPCLVAEIAPFKDMYLVTGGHIEFDLSRPQGVNFFFPPDLKMILVVHTNYPRSFTLSSQSARTFGLAALLLDNIMQLLLETLF